MPAGNFQSQMQNQPSGEYDHDHDKSSSQLNLANLIMVNIMILVKEVAKIDSYAKWNSVNKNDFSSFYISFMELFELTSHLIRPNSADQIQRWFDSVSPRESKSLVGDVKDGIKYAKLLKRELIDIGMMKIFERPIDPPFVLDFMFLDEDVKEEKIKDLKKKIAVK